MRISAVPALWIVASLLGGCQANRSGGPGGEARAYGGDGGTETGDRAYDRVGLAPAASTARADDPAPADGALCGARAEGLSSVYFGTTAPTYLSLAPGQVLAVGKVQMGSVGLCTGTVIHGEWVLTAKHCTAGHSPEALQFHLGRTASRTDATLRIAEVVEHATADVSLLRLTRDVHEYLPDLVPIRVAVDPIHSGWIGSTAEAAGYGENELRQVGIRAFTAQPIVALSRTMVTVDGRGQRGLCFGDSGGPLMIRAKDGSVRVLGALSGGDSSCVGRDNFTRLDAVVGWVEEHTGPTPMNDAAGCGTLTAIGRCMNDTAIWCGLDGSVQVESCETGSVCGWDRAFGVFACVAEGADPCDGVDGWGACDGDVAIWCQGGNRVDVACGECGRTCGFAPEQGGATCLADPCPAGGCDGSQP